MGSRDFAYKVITAAFGRKTVDRLKAAYLLGYMPQIERPRTYNEKVLHRKLIRPVPNGGLLSDKWRVRELVRQRVGEDILNQVYCVADRPDKIDFSSLPDGVVLKMNNASSRNIFVRSWQEANIEQIKRQLDYWFNTPFGLRTSELYYLEIPPLVMVERLLSDDDGRLPNDYKFYVFHGRCEFVEVHSDRFTAHKTRIYDRNWQPQPFYIAPDGPHIERPRRLSEMIDIAEALGADLDHVRVDLFAVHGRIIFSEFTLTQGSGYLRFHPREADFTLGSFWQVC